MNFVGDWPVPHIKLFALAVLVWLWLNIYIRRKRKGAKMPILNDHAMGRRGIYVDRRKNRLDRRKRNWLIFNFRRSGDERRVLGEQRRDWIRFCPWCSIYAPAD